MKKTAVLDCRIPRECERALKGYGYDTVKLRGAEYLAPEVASHPDMIILPIGDKLFCHARYLARKECNDTVAEIASRANFTVHATAEQTCDKYPRNVLFNAAVVGDILICSDHTSKDAICEAERRNMTLVKVKQGYGKCSSAVIGDSTIITADAGISRAAKENGIDVLLISAGGVDLPGYDTGFIGGTCGYDDGKLFFCGDLSLHPDGKRITEFCASHGCQAVSLCKGMKLFDVGTIFFF